MKTLGLDIGTSSIKAVVLEQVFGRIELLENIIEPLEHSENTISPEEKTILTQSQKDALKKILTKITIADKVIINLPKIIASTRIFNFPTKDRKTIQNSIQFELEDEIPFEIEKIIYDFSILHHQENNSTVLVAFALKKDLETLLEELKNIGLDPDCVTIETFGLSSLLKRYLQDSLDAHAAPFCIINIGASQSLIQIFLKHEPLLTHVSNIGGDHFTQAIANKYGLSFEQAEATKIENAFLLTKTHLNNPSFNITEDQKLFSQILEDVAAPLIREIKQTLIAYKTQYHHTAKSIYLTGGGSLIPNLSLYFEEQIQIPVYPFQPLSKIIGPSLQLSETTESRIVNAVGLSLSLIKPDKQKLINFRKDEFAKATSPLGSFNFKASRRTILIATLATLFILVNLVVQYFILSSKLTAQEDKFEKVVKSILGAVSPTVMNNYKSSPSRLKTAVSKELEKYSSAQPAKVTPALSGFDVLNKVSQVIPRDMTLDVSLFNFKEKNLILKGNVDNLNNADRIQKALESIPIVSSVKKVKADFNNRKQSVEFEFEAELKTGENKN
jgi:type IV pilus assembly protein PilM